MSRPTKKGKALNIKLDASLYERLENYSQQTKRTKTAIVELALEEYFKKSNKSSS